MIISDTIYYRPDGTISSVMRKELVTFTGPKSESFTKEVESPAELSDVTALAGRGYDDLTLQNKYLEGQIEAERVAAETDKLATIRTLSEAHAEAMAEKEQALAAKDAQLADKDAQIAALTVPVEQVQ